MRKPGELPIASFQGSSYELEPHPVPREPRNLKNTNTASEKTLTKRKVKKSVLIPSIPFAHVNTCPIS